MSNGPATVQRSQHRRFGTLRAATVVAEVDRVLRQLARHPTLTHEVLDQLPPGRTTDYMRNLILHDRLTDVTGTSVIPQWRAVFVTVTY